MTTPATPRPSRFEGLALLGIIGLALLAGAQVLWQRIQSERLRQVPILIYPEEALVQATLRDSQAPEKLRQAGVGMLLRTPYSLRRLAQLGFATIWPEAPDRFAVDIADTGLASSAAMHLTSQFGMGSLEMLLRGDKFILKVAAARALTPELEYHQILGEFSTGPMPEGFARALALPIGDWLGSDTLDYLAPSVFSLQPDLVMPIWLGGFGAQRFFHAYFHSRWLRHPVIGIPEEAFPPELPSLLEREESREVHWIARWPLEKKLPAAAPERWLQKRLRYIRILVPPGMDFPEQLQKLEVLRSQLENTQADGYKTAPRLKSSRLAISLFYAGIAAVFLWFLWELLLRLTSASRHVSHGPAWLTIRVRPGWFRWWAAVLGVFLIILHGEGVWTWGITTAAGFLMLFSFGLASTELFRPVAEKGIFADDPGRPLDRFIAGQAWLGLYAMGVGVLFFHPFYQQGFFYSGQLFWVYLVCVLLYSFSLGFFGIRKQEGQKKGWRELFGFALVLAVWLLGCLAWLRRIPDTVVQSAVVLASYLGGQCLLFWGLKEKELVPERVWPDWLIWSGWLAWSSGWVLASRADIFITETLLWLLLGMILGPVLGALVFVLRQRLFARRSPVRSA